MYEPGLNRPYRRFDDRPEDLAQLLAMARRNDDTVDLAALVRRVNAIDDALRAARKVQAEVPTHVPPQKWDAEILAPQAESEPGWFAWFGVVLLGAFIIAVAIISAAST